ncbi:MAG: tetratricopeptide repeat protein [Gemmatimonadales bacterium]|nr:tetratricopeptide repeat protein [Gemmatimonadales bacterium]
MTYGYLADAQVESGDLAGALASQRRSRGLRRELSAEFPDNATYAEAASTACYYEAAVLGRLGRWKESLALHRESLAEDSTGSFSLCRVGEALAGLGRDAEALGYLKRALRRHEQELRADTVNLFTRLAVVEDLARICKVLARLGRSDAPAGCARTTAFAEGISVEPDHAFPRAFSRRHGPLWARRTKPWRGAGPRLRPIIEATVWRRGRGTAGATRSGPIWRRADS